ncbi:MAG: hypothetical protein IJV15_10940 [Lachnospiraceae bacterium]|nr:hypothetical protein [Lachnospiraceae bacterium]
MRRRKLGKKIVVLVTAYLLAFSLSGCGSNNGGDKKLSFTGSEDNTTVESSEEIKEETTENAMKETTENTTEDTTEKNTTQDEKIEVDYEVVYSPVIDEVLDLIINGYDYEKDYVYPSTGIMESVMYRTKTDLLNNIGYVIEDINGDGVPELLIGEDMVGYYDDITNESYVYDGYTYKDGEIICFLEGWARSSYRWMGNGNFFYTGSSSAMSSMFGQCYLNEDGTKLAWVDFYYSDEVGDGSIGFYHNTSGMVDASASERLSLSDEEFWGLMDNYKCELLDWNIIGEGVELSDEDKMMDDIIGDWLFPNGAVLSLNIGDSWTLYDDEGNWLFGGDFETDGRSGDFHLRFFSEVGDTGNNQVASGTFYYDADSYPALDVEFEKYLTDFTDVKVTLNKALQ